MDIIRQLGSLHPKRSQCPHCSSPRDVSRGRSGDAKAVRENTDTQSLRSSATALCHRGSFHRLPEGSVGLFPEQDTH